MPRCFDEDEWPARAHLPYDLRRRHAGADCGGLPRRFHARGLPVAADQQFLTALVQDDRELSRVRPCLLGQPRVRRAVLVRGAAVRGACGACHRALSFSRPRRPRSVVPLAADDSARRAGDRLPALLHRDRHGRQFPGTAGRSCGGRVPVRTPADAGRGDRHGPLRRDGRGLARRRRLDVVPPRDLASDPAGRHQRLGACVHSVLRRSDHDRLPGRARHRDAARSHVPLYPGQHRSTGDLCLGQRDRDHHDRPHPARPFLRARPRARRQERSGALGEPMSKDYDVAVVGGGLLGSAIAWGLGRLGKKVVVLDEGDIAKRASRANFALVWVQSKGLGMPAYTGWTVRAAEAWGRLTAELKDQTGLDLALQQNGGFHLTLGEDEVAPRTQLVTRMHNQVGAADYRMEMLSASEVKRMLPLIGPEVSGGSFCPLDGHVNSLRTFRAFHAGLKLLGVDYFPERPVSAITRSGGEFRLSTLQGELRAGKVVLAAGNANQSLAPMVGLSAPMGPTRGQIVVTERTMPFLPHPLTTIRQTDAGTVMIGDSKEEQLDDRTLNHSVSAVMADRAQRTFPHLARLNVVRTWSGIRVMPQDGFPIYDQSESEPGAFVTCCHSGVTLASNHAFDIARMVAAGTLEPELVGAFSARRFDANHAATGSGYY